MSAAAQTASLDKMVSLTAVILLLLLYLSGGSEMSAAARRASLDKMVSLIAVILLLL